MTIAAVAQPAALPVRFTVFAAKPLENVTFLPKAGGPATKVAFYPTARSPRYEFRGPGALKFTDSTTGDILAEVEVPKDARDALLLFAPIQPAPASGPKYQILVLNETAIKQATGTLVIFNLSGLALTGVLNEKPLTVAEGANAPVPVGAVAKLVLHAGKRTAYADTVKVGPKQRGLLLLFPPFYKGSTEVQARLLVDTPGAPEATGAGKKGSKK